MRRRAFGECQSLQRQRLVTLRVHAIVLALNEEVFITNQLKTLYPFCSAISVLTQYDRDWYGKPVKPDRTLELVATHPDPEGKIHLVVRRWPDEAGARNSEMLAMWARPDRQVMSHGNSPLRVANFHKPPDYFWIVDADEFYDPATMPAILEYLARKKPRGMRVHGYNYLHTWNRRVPREVVRFCQFGFLAGGVLFKMRRTVSWNESRMAKLLGLVRLPDFSAKLWGFIECPPEVGVFHHGCWLGSQTRLAEKASRSSHQENDVPNYPEKVAEYPTEFVPSSALPVSIRCAKWPQGFLEGESLAVAGLAKVLRRSSSSANNSARGQ